MGRKQQSEIERNTQTRKRNLVKVQLSDDAARVYDYLREEANKGRKKELQLFNAFEKKIEIIKIDSHYGQIVSKNKIPDDYKKNYCIKNLYRVELPCFWRFLYSVTDH